MVKGLYTAYTGLLQQQKRLDVITNNLANAATTGFKKEGITSQSFADVMAVKRKDASEAYRTKQLGYMSMGVKIGETYIDYGQGATKVTENPYDLALEGNGFFAVSYTNKAGEQSIKYTRDGSFTLTTNGVLVTKDGDMVQGQNGNITVDPNADLVIDELGNVYADGIQIDRLNIVDFEDYNYLNKFGEYLFDLVDGGVVQQSNAKVHQGLLEASNVNVIQEMVDMINITRSYETNQKAMQTIDNTLDKAVNQTGKL